MKNSPKRIHLSMPIYKCKRSNHTRCLTKDIKKIGQRNSKDKQQKDNKNKFYRKGKKKK